MTDKYAVIGNPIAHSKSPIIHAEFAKQTNQDISYEAILAPINGLEAVVRDLIAKGYKGANVTVPFKFEAFELCDDLSFYAKGAGAVNILTFDEYCIKGENTDGYGLVTDILGNLDFSLENKDVLIIGAGGAARGVFLSIISALPASITIANRTLAKAKWMIQNMPVEHDVRAFAAITFEHLSLLHKQQFDIVINATSIGLTDTALPIPNSIFAKNCLAYDMMYGRETPFMAQARAAGAQVSDGLGMLVEQAAEAFFIWRGVRPETAPVIAMLRKAI